MNYARELKSLKNVQMMDFKHCHIGLKFAKTLDLSDSLSLNNNRCDDFKKREKRVSR